MYRYNVYVVCTYIVVAHVYYINYYCLLLFYSFPLPLFQDMMASSDTSTSSSSSATRSKVSVISQAEFESQRGGGGGGRKHNEESTEDDLQFDLDVQDGGEKPKEPPVSIPPPPPSTASSSNPAGPSPDKDTGTSPLSPPSLPWLEQRARFYPAPILPSKQPRTGKVRHLNVYYIIQYQFVCVMNSIWYM